ncbi:type VI secretion system baseplate subunit TssG [Photobacterium sp. SDRW27]|uniref:type VI secretion system baseplate subunit TssG n=1 Tax=Photobacterium obscurum TaxID=2829490 RepID=UPI00224449FB|nr:type VI secretion system baseplate subunit TssG [Photobacterium obscurum]MCW8327868.1 type VI secretion system baseplate subunit TssG [Photobacterium obscurum]
MQEHALTQLLREPYTFDLHRAVQLVKHEAATLGKRPALTFTASLLPAYQQADIVEVSNPVAGQWAFTCDLPALSGSQGVMPRHSYIESIKELFEQGNDALIDFLDGFNNRYYRLYCQAELKNDLAAQAEEEHFSWNRHSASLTTMLANLNGDLGNNRILPSDHLIQYSGLLGLKLSCPHTLKDLLGDYFEYEFDVEYGDVDYVPLLPCSVTKLGKTGQNNQLGFGALVGKSAVTAFQRLEIMIKPNNNHQFNEIRNDNRLVSAIDAFVRHYMGVDIKLKLMIKVNGKYLPGLRLSTESSTDIRLAQSTWLAPKQITREHVVMPLK